MGRGGKRKGGEEEGKGLVRGRGEERGGKGRENIDREKKERRER